jgi:hypothetical protein
MARSVKQNDDIQVNNVIFSLMEIRKHISRRLFRS